MKILVVDDHQLIREGLRPLLEKLASREGLELIEADTLAGALAAVDLHRDLDLALVDLRLPDVVGFEAVRSLRARQQALPVVVMSGDHEPGLVRASLEQGALGFIPKSSSPALILRALQVVIAGGTYVPREAIDEAEPRARGGEPDDGLGLTPRQRDVLGLMLAGKSNKAIGKELDLAEGTVKNHVAAIFKALEVESRTQAVIAAAKRGLKA